MGWEEKKIGQKSWKAAITNQKPDQNVISWKAAFLLKMKSIRDKEAKNLGLGMSGLRQRFLNNIISTHESKRKSSSEPFCLKSFTGSQESSLQCLEKFFSNWLKDSNFATLT